MPLFLRISVCLGVVCSTAPPPFSFQKAQRRRAEAVAGKRRDQTTAEIFGSYDEKDGRFLWAATTRICARRFWEREGALRRVCPRVFFFVRPWAATQSAGKENEKVAGFCMEGKAATAIE